MKHTDDPAAAGGRVDLVWAEDRKRIGMPTDDECVDGLIEWRFLRRGGGWRFGRDGRLIGQAGSPDSILRAWKEIANEAAKSIRFAAF